MIEILNNPLYGYVLLVLSLVIVVQLVRLLESKRREIDAGNYEWIVNSATSLAVTAVEQLAKSGQIEAAARRDKAVEIAEAFLAERGLKVDLDVLIAMIERGVFERNEV